MASLVDDSWPMQKGMTMTVLHNPLRTRLHSTGEEGFSVPSHWHSMHDENHVVLKGSMIVTQNGVKRVLRAGDGPCFTPRGMIHSLEILPGEEVIMEEETLPSEEIKEQKVLFFRNLFFPGVSDSFFAIMQLFYHGDTYPELPLGSRSVEQLMIVVVGGWVAPLLGYRLPDKRLRMDPKRFPH